MVKRDSNSEVEKLMSQPSKWTQPKTQYDHLPPHERPFNIQPFPLERNRLPFKMTDEDRSRRQRYLLNRKPYPIEIQYELTNWSHYF